MNSTNNYSSLAKAMTYISITIFIALGLYLYFDKTLQQQHNPNINPQSTSSANTREVVLQRNKYGHYVSSGTINSIKVLFLLDTGASDVSIPAHIAKKIGLKKGARHSASTANGTINVYATTLNNITLGAVTMHNVAASINPFMKENDILLGMSFLKELDFSQHNDQLTIRQYLPQ